MILRRGWWLLLVASVLMVSSGVVGCGCGDDDDDDSGGGGDDDTDDDTDDDVGDDDTGDDDTADDDTDDDTDDDADDDTQPQCVDADGDTHGENCDAGPDCDDADENNWDSCASCVDNDGDLVFAGCDAYDTIDGPDCNDFDPDMWQFLTGYTDEDGDLYPGTPNEVCAGGLLPVGYYPESTDCDDADILVNPSGVELPDDGIDQDCSGEDYTSADSNGYFVDGAGGNDANPGTKEFPVETIAQGVMLASVTDGGTNVYIAEGVYTEDVTTTVASLYGGYNGTDWSRDIETYETELIGSVDAGLTVGGATDVAVDGMTLRGSDAIATSSTGLVVILSNGVRISNCRIFGGDDNTAGGSYGAAVLMTYDAMLVNNEISGGENATAEAGGIYAIVDGFDVVNNTISAGESGVGAVGAYVYSHGDATIRDNVVDGGEAPGSTITWFQGNMTSDRNDIRGNTFTAGNSSAGPRMVVYLSSALPGQVLFQDNLVEDVTSAGPLYQGLIFLGPANLTVEGNLVGGSSNATTALSYGAIVDGPGNFHFANNMFDGGQATASTTAMILDVDDLGGALVNNTFVGGVSDLNSIGVYVDIDGVGGTAAIDMVNNIIDAGSGSANIYSLYLGQATEAGLMRLHGNDLTGASPDCLIYASTGAECTTTIGDVHDCDWHDCGAADGNLNVSPQYVNAAANDYHLASGSALRDAGVNPLMYVADPFGFAWRDFEGDVRPAVSTWDIGADEFIP
ncbi:MAG: right-handed parallel beta-helix repeat-containing protein [Deltaproteobacteria bacterium]|nr:right-handed parallel beta-helix repeat-containing protein [Deltaproteobacteria bacterium]